MANTLPLRHELKFFINDIQHLTLSGVLDKVLHRDTFGDENNEYYIRSLYFDTAFDAALYDKLDGVQNRDKYRIRIYNPDRPGADKTIKMECKTKVGSLISKRSITIPRDLCDQIIAGDPTGLETTRSGLLNDVYREMTVNLLRPAVIVDYVREAYTHPAEEVRITFDKQLRSGLWSHDLFNAKVPTIPPFDNNEIILEVKYNRVLPPYIRDLLCTYVGGATQLAISKYTWCRRYEDKEY
ncbi:MAG: polyphosphate polymerase domain-containing protein [Clostridia bacterium]|nr:polyphosphate polymerase domain-containing protein [Clostridia bacterium]